MKERETKPTILRSTLIPIGRPLLFPGGTLLWLDASDSSTISETAGTVSEWQDKRSKWGPQL